MIKIIFFASVRDCVGMSQTSLSLDPKALNSKNLTAREILIKLGINDKISSIPNLKCAINQSLATLDYQVVDGDELAFFPPVTGG